MIEPTGDDAADKLLNLILAFVHRLPCALRADARDGVSSVFFNFRYLAAQAKLDLELVRPALQRLEVMDFIRCDYGDGGYGVQVWIRARLEEAA